MVSQSRSCFLILTPPACCEVTKTISPPDSSYCSCASTHVSPTTAFEAASNAQRRNLCLLGRTSDDQRILALYRHQQIPTKIEFPVPCPSCLPLNAMIETYVNGFHYAKPDKYLTKAAIWKGFSPKSLSVAVHVHFQSHSSLLSEPIRRRKFIAGLERRRIISLVFSQRD